MRRVMIATPCREGHTSVWYNCSLNETLKLSNKLGVEIYPVYEPYDALIQRARNFLIALALESGVDDVIFIDADQEWNPQWIFDLLNYPVDVVGAAVPKKSESEEYNVRCNSLPIPVDIDTGLLIVDGLGTGLIRFSRKALLSLWDSSEEYGSNGRLCRMIFDVKVRNLELISEDNIACEKLREHGFKIYLDRKMTCGHIGSKKYTGNFDAYLKALEAKRVSVA